MSTVLEFYSPKDLLHRTSVREGETKLGQILPTISEADFNANGPLNYRFVIVGIEEDYGVRANLGRGGADKAFQAFLQHFCNLQDNRFFPSYSVAILGAVVPTRSIDDDHVEALREATAELMLPFNVSLNELRTVVLFLLLLEVVTTTATAVLKAQLKRMETL